MKELEKYQSYMPTKQVNNEYLPNKLFDGTPETFVLVETQKNEYDVQIAQQQSFTRLRLAEINLVQEKMRLNSLESMQLVAETSGLMSAAINHHTALGIPIGRITAEAIGPGFFFPKKCKMTLTCEPPVARREITVRKGWLLE